MTKTKYACDLCDMEFVTEKEALEHRLTHSEGEAKTTWEIIEEYQETIQNLEADITLLRKGLTEKTEEIPKEAKTTIEIYREFDALSNLAPKQYDKLANVMGNKQWVSLEVYQKCERLREAESKEVLRLEQKIQKLEEDTLSKFEQLRVVLQQKTDDPQRVTKEEVVRYASKKTRPYEEIAKECGLREQKLEAKPK